MRSGDGSMRLPDDPHRRRNPLTGRSVLVSAGRSSRPWLGRDEPPPPPRRPSYDPGCYLCPGNERAGGRRNPDYQGTFVFANDYPALRPDALGPGRSIHPLLQASVAPGACRVLCFSPRHDVDLAEMAPGDVRRVVDLWAEQADELGRTYRWVQIFENRGEEMGASSPHPHGQVWATAHVPDEPAAEDEHQRAWLEASGTSLLLDYAEVEVHDGSRLVVESAAWLAVVPFWAVWPFETILLPRRPRTGLADLADDERDALADVLRRLLAKYDNLFRRPFPYSMGWHGAPGGEAGAEHWQLHAHVYPPLLRSATKRKFMVGYEMLAEAQRDLSPEEAAERLRAQPDVQHRAGTTAEGVSG